MAGSPGQANHGAANAFEDALAFYRQARGQATVSINWGPWAEIGAAADRHVTASGLQAIAPADGLQALEYALRRAPDGRFAATQLAVLATDWSHLAGRQGEAPLFVDLATARPAAVKVAAVATPQPSLRERLRDTAPNRRRTVLRDHVRQLTVKVLGVPRPEDLDVNEPLRQMGLDSLMAVELRNLLGKAVGRSLPATVTFDHPSVAALAEHLASTVFADDLGDAAPVPAADALDDLSEEALARRLAAALDDETEDHP